MNATKSIGMPRTIGERVVEILVEIGIEASEIHSDAFLVEDLGIDSTELVEIVVTLEKQFAIRIPDRLNVKAKPTLGGLIDLVERLVREQRGEAG